MSIIHILDSSLPNGVLINNIANFYTNIKPLTRIDNSQLIIGDKWYNPNTNVNAIWNGTYWLGEIKDITVSTKGQKSTSDYIFSSLQNINTWFLQKVKVSYYSPTSHNDTNYWSIEPFIFFGNGYLGPFNIILPGDNAPASTLFDTKLYIPDQNNSYNKYIEIDTNFTFYYYQSSVLDLGIYLRKIGTPSNIYVQYTYQIREII